MTVKDLINVLLRCPDWDQEIRTRFNVQDEQTGVIAWVHLDITDIDEDHGTVLLDTETVPGSL